MRKLLLVVGAVSLLTLGLAGVVAADNGVHGGYTDTTDACAGCHRTHTAKGAKLLKSAATATDMSAFCYSCHSAGTGAYTDVMNGLFLSGATGIEPSGEVSTTTTLSPTRPLKGGGFVNTTMNPGMTGTLTLNTTSTHLESGGSNTVWGYGTLTNTIDYGALNVSLTCTNCHNPHGAAGANGAATYRILKGFNIGNTALFTHTTGIVSATVDVPDEITKTYFISDTNNNYYLQDYGLLKATLSDWCAQCHARYEGEFGSGSIDSNDPVFGYRHDANGTGSGSGSYGAVPSCINCHVAHGTGARMGANSGGMSYPDGVTVGNNGRSALLRLDNRGVCQQCHKKGK